MQGKINGLYTLKTKFLGVSEREIPQSSKREVHKIEAYSLPLSLVNCEKFL